MIYLASKSPRRQSLLQQIGIDFEVVGSDIDETPLTAEKPADYVIRMAVTKARNAVRENITDPASNPKPGLILAADTSVICDDRILGKPESRQDFLNMMALLSDNTHQVMTCVAVTNDKDKNRVKNRLSVSEVTFCAITPKQAMAYWETGEPADKAGGYAVQGKAAVFIKNISGSYSGIMGLPLHETAHLLKEFNHYSF